MSPDQSWILFCLGGVTTISRLTGTEIVFLVAIAFARETPQIDGPDLSSANWTLAFRFWQGKNDGVPIQPPVVVEAIL